LRGEFLSRGEPTLEPMARPALQVEDLHMSDSITMWPS
jgi:hypothetical protein